MSPTTARPRRLRRLTVLAAAAAVLTTACIGTGSSAQEVRSSVDRAAPEPETLGPIVDSVNQFGLALYGASDDAGNTALATVPTYAVLAMLLDGAEGTTREQLLTVLHASSTEEVERGFNTLLASLELRSGERRNDRRTGRVRVSAGASLWGQRGTRFRPEWLDRLARWYGQGVWVTDFASDPESSRDAIDNWARGASGDHIDELVPQGDISQYTRFVGAAVAYLEAPWQREFDPTLTRPRPFRLDGGDVVEVPTMQVTTREARVATGDGWEAVELPYLGAELSLVVLVPDAGRFDELDDRLDAVLLDDVLGRLQRRPVQLRLPSFGFTTAADLAPTVSAMGAPAAFSRPDAELDGITDDERLWVDPFSYEAFFGVDEEGSDATAATVATTGDEPTTGARQVDVDRPFVFFVHDRATGAVLLVGRYREPR